MLKRIFILLASASVFLCLCAAEDGSLDKVPPNIVYILADDMGIGGLSCYNHKKFTTPNVDYLARNGMRFSDHYSGSTVSAPSRAVLMTGQHTGHAPVRGNRKKALPDATVTVAEVLKEAGYATGVFGKWSLGLLEEYMYCLPVKKN